MSLDLLQGLTVGARDLGYLGALVVSIALSHGRVRSDVRHLDDVKADRHEMEQLGRELRSRLADIMTSLARLEQSMRNPAGAPPQGREQDL